MRNATKTVKARWGVTFGNDFVYVNADSEAEALDRGRRVLLTRAEDSRSREGKAHSLLDDRDKFASTAKAVPSVRP